MRLQSGVAEVRESGTYKSEIAFGAGDTFSIIVSNGAVSYAKNGGVFYASGSPATYAVRTHAIFFDANGTIRDVTIGGGGAPARRRPRPAPAPSGCARSLRRVRVAQAVPGGAAPGQSSDAGQACGPALAPTSPADDG